MSLGMGSHLLVLSLVLSAAGAAAQTVTTVAYQCGHVNGHAAMDMHCVEFTDGVPTFVKGVARMQTTYFEGPISADSGGHSAHVQTFGLNSIQFGGMPTPSSGAAQVTYSSGVDQVSWIAWAAGGSDASEMVFSPKNHSCQALTLTEAEMKVQCLWQPSSGVPAVTSGLDKTSWNTDFTSSPSTESIQICTLGLTTIMAPKGDTAGAVYPWRNAIRFSGRNSVGITSIVEMDGSDSQSALFSIVAVASVDGSSTSLYGWRCALDDSCLEQLQEGSITSCQPFAWSLQSTNIGLSDQCDVANTKMGRRFDHEVMTSNAPTTTEMMKCTSQSMQDGVLSEKRQEYHCVEYDSAGIALKTSGTFGMSGYFSGVFRDPDSPDMASVNWYAIDELGNGPVAISGSALLNYSRSDAVNGNFWSVNVGDDFMGPGMWMSSECTVMPQASSEDMAKFCFKSGNSRSSMDGNRDFGNGLHESLWFLADTEQEIQFCHDDMNTMVPHSFSIEDGACSSQEQCKLMNGFENRTYALSSLRFSDATSYGFVGVSFGPGLHGIPAVKHSVLATLVWDGEVVLQGFTCTWIPGRNTTTGCESVRFKQAYKWGRSSCEEVIGSQCHLDLSWQELRPMRSNGQYHTGGLADQSERYAPTAWNPLGKEYANWACVTDWNADSMLRCGSGPGKYVCFKYDEKSEKFDFWGLNHELRMVPPYA